MSLPTILENIVARKYEEVKENRARVSLDELQRLAAQADPTRGFAQALRAHHGNDQRDGIRGSQRGSLALDKLCIVKQQHHEAHVEESVQRTAFRPLV